MDIRMLGPGDDAVLERVAPGVFDDDIGADTTREFLDDPRHHIAVAIEDGVVVGFVSSVHYVHPDKARELWINEVAVAERFRKQGIARALMDATLANARALGCTEAWVLTNRPNESAMNLYARSGGVAYPGDVVMFEFKL
jgi:aminoglycoside 6'-N-acetyltransferase I